MRGYLIFLMAIVLSSSVHALVFTVNEGELVKLKLNAYDPDGRPLIYNFTPPLNEKGEWRTQIGDAGTYNVIVTVSDGEKIAKEGLTLIVTKKKNEEEPGEKEKEETEEEPEYEETLEKEEEWKEEVTEGNHPPRLEQIEDVSVSEGDLVKIIPNAADEDNDAISYEFAYPLNEKGEWQTKLGDSGEYIVTVSAADGKSVDSRTFKIIVNEKEKKEIIFEKIDDIELNENDEASIELKASAEEGNIEFFAENMPDDAALSGNIFHFKPSQDYVGRNILTRLINKLYPYTIKKSKTITFTAKSDDQEIKQKVKITVKDVNRAPGLEVNDIEVNEGETVKINPVTNDPDGDWLKVSYKGDIKNNYKTSFGDSGTYQIKVTASDPFASISKDVNVIVNKVNRKPVLDMITQKKNNEGEELNFKITASDSDNDKLGYYIINGPGSINGDVFSWISGYDFVKKNNEQDLISKIKYFNKKNKNSKETEIRLGVSDGNLTDEGSFKVVVYDVNRMPEIINFEPDNYIIAAKGGRIIFRVNATDLDEDELTYDWNFGIFNSLEAGDTVARTFTTKGMKTIKVKISDGVDEIEKVWKVRVI